MTWVLGKVLEDREEWDSAGPLQHGVSASRSYWVSVYGCSERPRL